MKRVFLLLLWLFPVLSWACSNSANGGDVTIASLPPKVLLSAGNYSAGTIIYDSGKISANQTSLLDCRDKIYAQFTWAPGMAGSQMSDQIYSTSLPGIGIRVKVWLNITGEYGNDSNDFNSDYSEHRIGDADFYLGQPGGFLDTKASTNYAPTYQLQLIATGGAIASGSMLTLGNPTSTVSIKDGEGTMAVASLRVTGSTQIQLVPMGCTANTSSLMFNMGAVSTSAFDNATTAGESARQSFTLNCEPGTSATMRINATEAEGDNPEHTVIALTPGEGTATGVGVQLMYSGVALNLNTNYQMFPRPAPNRTTVTNPGAEASYLVFTDPDNPGGAPAEETFPLTAVYYKTGAKVTAGKANASGTITIVYN